MMDFDWRDDIIAKVRQWWDSGVGTSEIGKRIGTTKNAVLGKVHRLGWPKRQNTAAPLSPSEKAKLIEDLRSGTMSAYALAAKYHMHMRSVQRISAGAGISMSKRSKQPKNNVATTGLPKTVILPPPRVHGPLTTGSAGCRSPAWSCDEPIPQPPVYCGAPIERGSYCAKCARYMYYTPDN